MADQNVDSACLLKGHDAMLRSFSILMQEREFTPSTLQNSADAVYLGNIATQTYNGCKAAKNQRPAPGDTPRR